MYRRDIKSSLLIVESRKENIEVKREEEKKRKMLKKVCGNKIKNRDQKKKYDTTHDL